MSDVVWDSSRVPCRQRRAGRLSHLAAIMHLAGATSWDDPEHDLAVCHVRGCLAGRVYRGMDGAPLEPCVTSVVMGGWQKSRPRLRSVGHRRPRECECPHCDDPLGYKAVRPHTRTRHTVDVSAQAVSLQRLFGAWSIRWRLLLGEARTGGGSYRGMLSRETVHTQSAERKARLVRGGGRAFCCWARQG